MNELTLTSETAGQKNEGRVLYFDRDQFQRESTGLVESFKSLERIAQEFSSLSLEYPKLENASDLKSLISDGPRNFISDRFRRKAKGITVFGLQLSGRKIAELVDYPDTALLETEIAQFKRDGSWEIFRFVTLKEKLKLDRKALDEFLKSRHSVTAGSERAVQLADGLKSAAEALDKFNLACQSKGYPLLDRETELRKLFFFDGNRITLANYVWEDYRKIFED